EIVTGGIDQSPCLCDRVAAHIAVRKRLALEPYAACVITVGQRRVTADFVEHTHSPRSISFIATTSHLSACATRPGARKERGGRCARLRGCPGGVGGRPVRP